MTSEISLFLACAVGYLLGSLSFARIVIRLFAHNEQVHAHAVLLDEGEVPASVSGVGGTSAAAVLGPRYGLLVVGLDMLKVAIPVLVFRLAFPEAPYYLLVALAGIAGHNWPIYYGFRGGRGFSCTLGALLVIDPLAVVVTPLLALFIGTVIARSVTIAYVGWLPLLIPWFWIRTGEAALILFAVALNVLFTLATWPEIAEMLRYRREGRLDDYVSALESSSVQRRAIQRMIERFDIRSRIPMLRKSKPR
jgi:acyl phosphate:glycerol-3-phosphate acyltransferase